MAHPYFLSGTIGDLAQVSVQKSRRLDVLLQTVLTEDKISVVLPDFTRPLPFEHVLPLVEKAFPNMRHWLVGLGLHRGLTPFELSQLRSKTQKPILQHDPDDCCTIEHGENPFGISRYLFESDWILTTGVIETHQYAGVSGGYKGVIVGCGSRASISRLHAREMVCHSKVQVGKIVDNPFRDEIERLGRLIPYTLALMWVPSLEEWWFGTPEAILVEAHRSISPWTTVHRRFNGVVLHVPRSKGVSLYQASRAATYLALSPNPPLKQGAKIVIDAQMPEGLGTETGFVRALETYRPPWNKVLITDLVGSGSQRMWMLARLAQQYTLYVRSVLDPEPFNRVGIQVFWEDIPEDWLHIHNPFNSIPQFSN